MQLKDTKTAVVKILTTEKRKGSGSKPPFGTMSGFAVR